MISRLKLRGNQISDFRSGFWRRNLENPFFLFYLFILFGSLEKINDHKPTSHLQSPLLVPTLPQKPFTKKKKPREEKKDKRKIIKKLRLRTVQTTEECREQSIRTF